MIPKEAHYLSTEDRYKKCPAVENIFLIACFVLCTALFQKRLKYRNVLLGMNSISKHYTAKVRYLRLQSLCLPDRGTH